MGYASAAPSGDRKKTAGTTKARFSAHKKKHTEGARRTKGASARGRLGRETRPLGFRGRRRRAPRPYTDYPEGGLSSRGDSEPRRTHVSDALCGWW